ncbi:MAG: MerR family DNA-binding protein [Proteobacteria bacterium]|nr:MerR family DNA-binding protein [Pseudomonadota bacterium]
MESMGIGAVAKAAGVGIDTVRYYERAGLVAPKGRLSSGYRRYSELEVSRLRFIRRAQSLGFSLKEIRELLALSSSRNVASVKRKAEAKLADVDRRLTELKRIRAGLSSLVEACPGHGLPESCPILQALGGESP